MMESGAIVEHLQDKYGDRGLRPARGTERYSEYLQWLHYVDATAFAPLGLLVGLTVYRDYAEDTEFNWAFRRPCLVGMAKVPLDREGC